jgi:aryl-alcohol dehydrogenase-like predicted oxidoreductase
MSGLLTGKYRKGGPIPDDTRVAKYDRYRKLLTDENLDKVEALIEYAESRGHTILELAVSWLIAHRVVASVIAGATSAQQLRANGAAATWKLSQSDLTEIDTLLRSAQRKATAVAS